MAFGASENRHREAVWDNFRVPRFSGPILRDSGSVTSAGMCGSFSWFQYGLAPLRLAQVFGAFSFCCRDLPERSQVGKERLGDGLAVNKLPFALAGDQSGFVEDFEMVRDGRWRHTSHGDDFAASHLVGCRDRLKYPEPGFVSQRLRYLFNLRQFHIPS
jgi:hypothetical protein